jgi:hypothetical protein
MSEGFLIGLRAALEAAGAAELFGTAVAFAVIGRNSLHAAK